MRDSASGALPRRANRSWWMEEALAVPELAGEPTPPLDHDLEADVLVLGGGYTGMWSAWFLKEREPDAEVVLLEQDVCGGGPSGRNGGFVNALWDEIDVLVSRYGQELAMRIGRAAAESVGAVGAFCEEHAIDAWYERNGNVGVASSPAQEAEVGKAVERAERFGIADEYVALSPGEVRARCNSPLLGSGVLLPNAAVVQPARLARALRRVLLDRGVQIFEGTPVTRFRAGSPVEAETPGGTVRARRGVLGVNAWGRSWRAFRRSLLVRGTYIVITAPAPERLADIGWTGGEGVYDHRTALHYLRTTPDGRIAFGGPGMRVVTRDRIHERFDYDERSVRSLVENLYRWFPAFRDVELEAAWGGPIDVSGLHLPFVGTLPGGTVHHALGFTGNGVGPCHLAGRILSGLALDVVDEVTRLPLIGDRPKTFPPEPLFTPGERLVTHAILRTDALEDIGREPGPLTGFLAHLPRRLGYNLGP
jgi:glycine/D-amino acid oxidase-like deaminating enzyme